MTDRPRIDQQPGGLGQPTGTTTAEDLSATFRQTTGPQTSGGQPLRARVVGSVRRAGEAAVNATRTARDRANAWGRQQQQEADRILRERGGWQEEREFVLADGTNIGTKLNDRLVNPVWVTVNGQRVRLEEFRLSRQPQADAVGVAGARLVEETRDAQGAVRYTRLTHDPNGSMRLNRGRHYFVEVPLGDNQEPERIHLERFRLDGEEAPTGPAGAAEPATRRAPTPAPDLPTISPPLEQLEKRAVIAAVKSRERRKYDLVNKALERAKGFGKQAFRERVAWRLDKYYDELLDISQSPFAEEAIRLAETKAEATFADEQSHRTRFERAARDAWENIKAFTWGQSRVQELTILELQHTQDQQIQAALARGKTMYQEAKGNFAQRMDLAFDNKNLAIREHMGENFEMLQDATIDRQIKSLISRYMQGQMTDDEFNQAKGAIWTMVKTNNPGLLSDAEDYADTLLAVGKQFKGEWDRAHNDTEGRNRLNNQLNAMRIALATGQMGEATQMKASDTKKTVEWIKKFVQVNPIGIGLFNEATVGTALSYVLSVKSFGSMAVTSTARMWGGFAAGGTAAGLIGAAREKGRLTSEFWAYLGEREAGVTTLAGAKKREWFDKLDIKRRKSDEVVTALRANIYDANGALKTNLTDDELRKTLGELADAKARWALSSRAEKRVALIEIGGLGTQERNRTEFVRGIDNVEKDLGQYVADHTDLKARLLAGQEYNTFLNGLTTTQTQILEKGKNTFTALQDPAQKLALTHVAGYTPEVEKLRHRIAFLWGERNKSVGTASGLEAALKEFNRQANEEAIKRGIYTGAIGMGIGALTQEAIMDWKFAQANGWQGFGTLGHGTFLAGAKDLIGMGDGASPLVHPELVGDNFVQHSQNLHFDNQGNLDLVKPDGTLIRDDIVSATDISFDADGTFSQHTADTLSAKGFDVAEGIDAIQPAHTAGMHPLWFGQDEVTVSNDLQWVDNGDGTSRLVLIVEDGSHNQFESLVHARSILSQGSPNDVSAVIADIDKHPLLDFTPGHETIGADLPLDKVHVAGIPDISDAAGGVHPVMAQIPDGSHFQVVDATKHVYDLVDSNNTTLLHGVDFDAQGHITNEAALKADALQNHFRYPFGHLHETITVPGEPGGGAGGDFDIRAGFLDDQTKYMGHNTVWEWGERTLQKGGPQDNLFKNAFRAWHHWDGSDNADIVDAEAGGIKRLVHRVAGGFTMSDGNTGYENSLDFNRLPDNLYIRDVPESLFSDTNIHRFATLMDDSIKEASTWQAANAAANVDDVLAHMQATDELQYLAYKHGYLGKYFTEADWDRFRELFGGGAPPSSLTLHTAQMIQQAVEATPPAIEIGESLPNNIILAPLTEPPQIPIPIIPILRRRGLEPGVPAQPTPPEPRPRPRPPIVPPYGGDYGYENMPYQGDQSVEYYLNWLNGTPFSHVDAEPYVMRSNDLVHENGDRITRSVDRERRRIKEYLDRQNPEYLEELRRRATEIPPMSEKTRAMMHLVMFQEEKYAYDALSQWLNQTANKDTWEITVLVNRRQSNQEDRTLEEVKRFQADHPEINVHVLHKVFPDAIGGVGAARKYTTDLALLRSINRPRQDGPLYILSEDAETNSVDPKTIERIIKKYDDNPQLDALRGKQYFDDNVLRQNDLLKFDRFNSILIEQLLRDQRLRPEVNENFSFFWNTVITGGWNTSFTADVYAQIDGYGTRPWLDQLGTTEDVDIGRRISILRSNQTRNGVPVPNTHSIGTHPSKLRGSPRRFLHSLASGIGAYAHFDDEQVSAQIRHGDTDEMLKRILPVARLTDENKGHFENYLTSSYNTFRSVTTDQELSQKLWNRYLLGVGLGKYRIERDASGVETRVSTNDLEKTGTEWHSDYHIEPDGRVVLDNVDNLAYALEAYRAGQARTRPKIWEVKKEVISIAPPAQPPPAQPPTIAIY